MSSSSLFAFDGRSFSSPNHYTFIDNENKASDYFINQSNFLQCQTQRHCYEMEEDDERKPHNMIYLLREIEGGKIFPLFLKCDREGRSMAMLSEDLVDIINLEVEVINPCKQLSALYDNHFFPPNFVDGALEAVENYDEDGCPENDASCEQQIYELFEQDLKNALNLFSWGAKESDTTEMGCLSNVLANLKESIVATVKLFIVDMPYKAYEIGESLWNYVMGEEEETSTSMLYASVMSEDMAKALSRGDFALFYSHLRSNFFEFIGNIREFYGELLGCLEWEGEPFHSTCLRRTNWSCITCENMVNFACGIIGQLGTGFALGAILGTTRSIVAMSQLSRNIKNNPSRYGLPEATQAELQSRQSLTRMRKMQQNLSYQITRTTPPSVQNFLRSAADEISFVTGMGSGFRNFIASNPVTSPYNLIFQYGQGRAFRAISQGPVDRIPFVTSISAFHLSRHYATGMSNIRSTFNAQLRAFYSISGNNFNAAVFNNLARDYITAVGSEMRRMGVQVTPIQGGRGLRLSKGGEVFEYRPNFRNKLESVSSTMSFDDFSSFMHAGDALLDGVTPIHTRAATYPNFLRDISQKAEAARNIFVIQPNALDGMAYLGHFAAQTSTVPDSDSCNRLLYELELIEEKDITSFSFENKDGQE